MKIDRHIPRAPAKSVKLPKMPHRIIPSVDAPPLLHRRSIVLTFVLAAAFCTNTMAQMPNQTQRANPPTLADTSPSNPMQIDPSDETSPFGATAVSQPNAAPSSFQSNGQSDPRAVSLLHQVLKMLVFGPAFHAKIRETVWTHGREVVGVGTYEQAGGGSGRYNLQVTMHDGDGKHQLRQISDGRLAWTRQEIAGNVSLCRVDVGRLDEWVSQSQLEGPIAPRLTVGAWAEMLTTIERDYVLGLVGAKLDGEPVWVLTGKLRANRRAEILAESGGETWPMLYPTRVHIAIRRQSNPETNIGELLPIRFEFWSAPIANPDGEADRSESNGRLITLIELYAIQPISPPPAERFRFENHDDEVNFINETDRYIQAFGVRLTERQMRQLRR